MFTKHSGRGNIRNTKIEYSTYFIIFTENIRVAHRILYMCKQAKNVTLIDVSFPQGGALDILQHPLHQASGELCFTL